MVFWLHYQSTKQSSLNSSINGSGNTPYFFTLTFDNMIEKIINGTYKAKLLKKRLCDVKIIVWGNDEPKTIEQVSYNEYNIIEPYLVKEGE